jgi:hypothetical protein
MSKDIASLIKPGMGMKVTEKSLYDYDEWNGRLMIYEVPITGAEYILGVDTAEGVGGDNSTCEVIKKGTLIYPDEQVAEFACNFLGPIDFAAVVNTIGRFYKDPDGTEAMVTIETNNPAGSAVLNTLRTRLDYTNQYIRKDYERRENLFVNKFGWHTTRHNRGLIIARGLHAFQYGDLIINSQYLLDEMADFESNHDLAQAKVKRGKGHDDRIMAILIGYFGGHDDEWLSGDDIAEERRLRARAGEIQEQMMEENNIDRTGKKDFQNQAITFRDMMSQSDAWILDD